jgi:hypothetical protein
MLALAPLAMFLILFGLIYRRLPANGVYIFDPADLPNAGNTGTFAPHNSNYLEISKLVVGLASASIAALAVFFFRDNHPVSEFRTQIQSPLICFTYTVVFGVSFIGALAWCYERYSHFRTSYTRTWYALVNALGLSMLIALVGGYVSFVTILLW